jgi:hypothetical protein
MNTTPLLATPPVRQPLLAGDFSSNRLQRRSRLSPCASIASALILALLTVSSVAQANSKQQMQSLDEQVQEIKSDALSIAAELSRLEEKLLYPSNTQVAVFVSLVAEHALRLDSVRVQIDGELVAHHIYSFKELEALEKGGVQRIYTGNVATGEHQLEVSVAGKLPSGADFNEVESFSFSKAVEPKLVEISLAGGAASGALIQLGSQ